MLECLHHPLRRIPWLNMLLEVLNVVSEFCREVEKVNSFLEYGGGDVFQNASKTRGNMICARAVLSSRIKSSTERNTTLKAMFMQGFTSDKQL